MAKPSAEAPRRWAEGSASGDDARLSELFRAVHNPQPLPSAALARVHDQLGFKRHALNLSRRARELVMALGMLVLGSSLALAGWGASEWLVGRSQRARPLAPETAAPKAGGTHRDRQRLIPEKSLRASPEQQPARPLGSGQPSASGEPSAVQAPAAASVDQRGAPPAAADSSGLAAEARALELALFKLRREHDARGALAVLDESRALFARGALALEAQVARVDALLALGRRAEALAILEQLPLAQIGRGGELQLMRAELRAANDCGYALADFDLLVTRSLAAPLLERVLYGRAACEL
ncbi:MAG TPA: hypothetical protein VGJ91_10530, partial [Polyangiaceae bacterium]